MKVSAMAMILLAASAGTAGAEDATALRTDCVWWNHFGELSEVGIDPMLPKLSYIAGVYDGLVFGKSQIRDNFVFTRNETLSAALDRFCAEERNRRVPLVPALRVISMELKGQNKAAIEAEMRRLRAQAGKPGP
jgi:hypothetical protein